jgi:hypothetical protein
MASPLSVPMPSDQGFEQPPPGNHAAACVAVVDLGIHTETFTNDDTGAETEKDFRKVFLCWELTRCKKSGSSENHAIGKAFNLTFGRGSALRELVESWSNKSIADLFKEQQKEFDVMKLLGKKCFLTIIHEPGQGKNAHKQYARIKSVTAPPGGSAVPAPSFPLFSFNVADSGGQLPDVPSWMPRNFGVPLADIISQSIDFKRLRAPRPAAPPAEGLNETGAVADAPDESEIPW